MLKLDGAGHVAYKRLPSLQMRVTPSICAQPRIPGSASVSDAGEGVLAIADFSCAFFALTASEVSGKVRFGATPKAALMRRALPGTALFLRTIAVTSCIS